MFGFLVNTSLRHRLFVLAGAVLLIAYGAFIAPRLPVDVFPDLNRPTVVLMTEAEGLAPHEVEQLVTYPIETGVSGMPGAMRVRSVSSVALSIVYIEFNWNTEIYRARQQVAERLSLIQARLPRNVQPQMGPISSIMGEIMLIALSANQTTGPMELRELADFVIRPQLLSTPGVAQIIPIGGEVRQYRVAPDPVQLTHLGITPQVIEQAVTRFGANTGGGFIDQHAREYLIRNIGMTNRLEDLRNLVVSIQDGRTILLRQVANVDFAPRPKRGTAGFQGAPAVIISVQKQPGADTIAVTREIESRLADIQKTLPADVRADQVQFRQASFIETSIANVARVLLEATAVVAVILVLFLMNTRATLISLTAIPMSVMITAIVFHLTGMSINTMTLGGLAIAIGELVDDAVVDVENILRRLQENREKVTPASALAVIAAASMEVRSGIVYATAIIVLVFVPLFALSGIEGRLFAPLGIAYIVSILASLLTSITLTPVLSFYLLSGPKSGSHKGASHKDTWLIRTLKAGNARLLSVTFRHAKALMATIALGLVIASVGLFQLPRLFLPAFNEGTLLVSIQFNPGISLAESDRLGMIAEKLAKETPEAISVGRRTGRAELDEHAEGVHTSEIDIALAPSIRSREAVFADLRARLSTLPAQISIGQPIAHRLEHMLSGVRAQLAVKISGDDLDTLRALAASLQTRLQAIPGLVDLSVEKQVLIPQLNITPDPKRAALYGMTPAALTDALEGLSNGRIISQIIEGNKRYDVVIRLNDSNRSTSGLANLLVATPTGFIPLRLIATVEETEGPNQIMRENGQRRIIVSANGDGKRDMAGIVADIRSILAQTPLPSGYIARLEGSFQAQEEATLVIGSLSLVSLTMIFLVLYSRYRSVTLAGIILMTIPLALIGSVLALWISGQPLSVASMIGFITLTGISARNGILKISHYINLALHDGLPFGRDLVIRGSIERITPVLMTALCAGLALLPLVFGGAEPGREILHPVAVTIFGGLISSTLLDTLLTPVLFLKFGQKPLAHILAEHRAIGSPVASPENAY